MFYVVDAITLIVKITSWLHWAAMPVKSFMQLGDKILKKKQMQQYNHWAFFCHVKKSEAHLNPVILYETQDTKQQLLLFRYR